jgi:hypothetical protein
MDKPLENFSGGNQSARNKLNAMTGEVNKFKAISGDGLIQVMQTTTGVTLKLNMEQLLPRIPKVVGGTGIRRAFCKTDAGAATTILAYLDTDTTGTEVTVHCTIAGGGYLNAATPALTDGLEIPVWDDNGTWKCLWGFQHWGAC